MAGPEREARLRNDPAIHALPRPSKDVEARVKPGHDEFRQQ